MDGSPDPRGLPELPVPVSMGSPRFRVWVGESASVTHAWFPAGAVLQPHTHDRPNFAIILRGGFDLTFTSPAIRNRRLPCPAGTVFTEPAGEGHANHCFGDGAQVVVIQPGPQTAPLPEACVRLLDRVNHFRDGLIEAAARRLAREMLAPDDVTPLAVEDIALEMLAEAARLDAAARLTRRPPPGWLLRVVECLHGEFRRHDLRMASMAAVAGVHPAHVAAVFRGAHRVSIGAYVRRLRVDWAADRLVDTGDPISLVAADAGFADQAHLTRRFRRLMGTTPAAYRTARSRPGALPPT